MSARSRILRISRDVVAEWNLQPKLQEVLREARPEFARTMDELAQAVYESGNRARLQEAAVERAKLAGAHAHELNARELVR
jgi:predicted Zn-dependent protease